MKGISLSVVLQVISLERQSCDIEARSGGKAGRLHFRDGILVDAIAGDLGGEGAAYVILGWDRPELEVCAADAPRDRTITTGLTGLLLETARRQDEEDLGELLAREAPEHDFAVVERPAEQHPAEQPANQTPAAAAAPRRAPSRPDAAELKRILAVAQDGLGDGLLSADVCSSADGTSLAGVNHGAAAGAPLTHVTARLRQSLKKDGLPALGRYYLAELEGDKVLLVVLGDVYQIRLVVDSVRAQIGLLVGAVLPEMLAALDGLCSATTR